MHFKGPKCDTFILCIRFRHSTLMLQSPPGHSYRFNLFNVGTLVLCANLYQYSYPLKCMLIFNIPTEFSHISANNDEFAALLSATVDFRFSNSSTYHFAVRDCSNFNYWTKFQQNNRTNLMWFEVLCFQFIWRVFLVYII